jgi:hypothetical protein
VKSSGTHQSNRVSLIEPREFYVHRVLRVSLQNYSKVLRVSLIEPREFYVYCYRLWNCGNCMVIVIGIVQSLDLYCDYKCFGICSRIVKSSKLYRFSSLVKYIFQGIGTSWMIRFVRKDKMLFDVITVLLAFYMIHLNYMLLHDL